MLIIGIAGGTGSGKTTVVQKITGLLKKEEVVVIPQDSYYKDNSHLSMEERQEQNFDHPDSVDFDLLIRHLTELKQGRPIEQPVYSYITCSRSRTETVHVDPAHIIIVEGILIFTCPELREKGMQYNLPVRIADNVWIGAGAIVLPGVTIGENSVIGAGSVVTRDIPANTVAVGNPCRVMRSIDERDRQYYYRQRKIDWENLRSD